MKIVLLDAQLTINAIDLTQWVSKIELSDEFEDKAVTTFASGKAQEVLGGLEKYSVAINFKNSYTVSELDAIMWPLRRTVVTWFARPTAAVVGVSNPQYSGSILINKWVPIAGSVGDVAEVDVTFPGSGPMARATS